MKIIAKALLEAQKKIQNASKDAKNTHFKNTYATLESVLDAVKEAANGQGIAILQTAGKDNEGHFIDTILMHESGESVSSKVYLVLDKQNMQGLGSAITYGRRYSLAGLFAIGQDDDDGNKASGQGNAQQGQQNNQAAAKQVTTKPAIKPASVNAEFDAPQAYTHPAAIDATDAENYTIPFGQKYNGKKFSDINHNDLMSYANWLKDQKQSYQSAEFFSMLDKYIATR